jgi:hypothetical protein
MQFPEVKGKVVEFVQASAQTEGASRIVIEEATLSDWKTGDDVIKRTYIQSREVKAIAAQEPEFQRICRQIEREKNRKGK